jgi:hypothetical protein
MLYVRIFIINYFSFPIDTISKSKQQKNTKTEKICFSIILFEIFTLQCRFEKLDITPKSAQKIKPVLERWMKEAEER